MDNVKKITPNPRWLSFEEDLLLVAGGAETHEELVGDIVHSIIGQLHPVRHRQYCRYLTF